MELQLSLSLSSSSSSSSSCFSHKFDLNDCSHDNVQGMEDLKKRKVCVNGDEDGGIVHVPKTLPLLFCNKSNQQQHDDDVNEAQSTFIFINHKNDGEESVVVGWPPVKSIKKKLCGQKNRSGGGGGGETKSMYVKVQMEGDGIARKIDLNLHHSYHTLVHTLAHMFEKCNEDVKLTYQDTEGDWLLAGDVPWGSFIETVRRLKLLKSNC